MGGIREPTRRADGIGRPILLGTAVLALVCLALGLAPLLIGMAG